MQVVVLWALQSPLAVGLAVNESRAHGIPCGLACGHHCVLRQ